MVVVCVVVMGDVGRSPRMQYHALSLARRGYAVTLVGYTGEECCDDVSTHGNIRQARFDKPARLKFVVLFWRLLWTLLRCRPDLILAQTPPFQTLFVAWLCRSILVADWHNLGFTLTNSRLHRFLEGTVAARCPKAHLCVTAVMSTWLSENFGINARVAPDRPASYFALAERKSRARPLLVSSTSWTPDEDFGVLLDALEMCKSEFDVVVTGKGQMRQDFEKRMPKNCKCAWLSSNEYAELLASADLGISLHSSTSKLDLPMKILDFFGAGLPVLSFDYPAISELVTHGHNGLLFTDARSLASSIDLALSPVYGDRASKLRKNVATPQSWEEMWESRVRPVIEEALVLKK